MGVPKFTRFLCQRYPCILELLNNHQIPEFDNLYLDMNGIIHSCSHPNDADAHFRITEETIFKNIFQYLEMLFCIIKPKKLFFMAVDGVAPRAKINQQRGRRFMAAREAAHVEAQARARGETISDEPKFDSNCITPGTHFMAKLTEQLKYFMNYKISTDKLWQKCKIILSGPDVPGEGEHKIMDYIRYMKSQPDHDPNTRHCFFGLDADLIMLSLCTHEPHFTVLREEVKYGKKTSKNIPLGKTEFCLLHVSLLREYLEHEFETLRDKLSFPFDTEKIIDDWILMGFLIGNDFIPHLPNLHINTGAFSLLYEVYKEILPTLDGYINEAGVLNLERFEIFMERLAVIDVEHFAEHSSDLKYFAAKTGQQSNENEQLSNQKSKESKNTPTLSSQSSSPKIISQELNTLIQLTDEILLGHSDEEEELDTDSDSEMYNLEFLQHKRDYYMNKFAYGDVDANVMRSQAETYITAIQWNLHYYYDGCVSWGWYYPHNYAPYISDIKGFKDFKFNFEMGKPFLPFQQLLAVLPAASKALLPQAYQGLMTEDTSPIIDFYPIDFETDLNEKKQEWEALVLIPFIDEKLLIDAMEPFNSQLTPEEKIRNQHGPMYLMHYTEENLGTVVAPDYFPSIESHAKITPVDPKEIEVSREKLVKGLIPNVKLHVYYSGFPTLQHIKHSSHMEKAKVKVFEQPSRDESIILKILPIKHPKIRELANDILGKIIYVKWPHLTEAHVIAVSNIEMKITLINLNLPNSIENTTHELFNSIMKLKWTAEAKDIGMSYKNRYGIDVGDIEIIVHARTICGRRYIVANQERLSLEKEWSNYVIPFAYQSIVRNIEVEDGGYIVHKNVTDIYQPKSICFMLGHPHYGAMGEVVAPGMNVKTGRVKVAMRFTPEPNFESLKCEQRKSHTQYMYGNIAAQHLGISTHLLSRITGAIFVSPNINEQSDRRRNIGLNLKFNKKNEELPGYTRKFSGQWLYSPKTVNLVRNYMMKFPILFERLAQNIRNDVYSENELFIDSSQSINDVLEWMKEQPFHCVELTNCDWSGVNPEIIEKIANEIDNHLEQEAEMTKTILMQVKPHLLYKSCLNLGKIPPDPKVEHKIFDRIIAVREDSNIPLGYKGTIVNIQNNIDNPDENLYDILFDKSFIGGISFTGGTSQRRHKLFAFEFINLTYGIRIEQNITDICIIPEKSNRKKVSVNSANTQNTKSSAFASFNKHDNFLPVFCKNSDGSKKTESQIRVMSNNTEMEKSLNSPIKKNSGENKNNTQNPTVLPSPKQSKVLGEKIAVATTESSTATAKTTTTTTTTTTTPIQNPHTTNPDRSTEFQLLWNELHKLPTVPVGEPTKPMAFPTMFPPRPPLPPATNSPQDPSAFLKAILRIPDDKSVKNSPQSSAPVQNKSFVFPPTPPVPPSSSTPNLVKELFDHARQANRNENISYCALLLNFYMPLGVGMPRYFYSTDENNLSLAQIALPDGRNFVGEKCVNHEMAAESAALKVCKELNVDRISKPRPFFDSMTQDTWMNIPPPPNIMLNTHTNMFSRSLPDAQKPTKRPPANWNPTVQPRVRQESLEFTERPPVHINHTRSQPPAVENKVEEKQQNITPFVPLQAQKQTRSRKPKEISQLSQSDSSKNQKVQKIKGTTNNKSSSKTVKSDKSGKINEILGSARDIPNQGQRGQETKRQRKSRIAANFGASTAANAANDNKMK